MSIFSSRTITTIPILFDLPHEVTIQKLSGRHLDRAGEAWLAKLYAGITERGGSKVQKDVAKVFESDDEKDEVDEQVEKVKTDPLNGLDPYVVMACGIVAWTYPDSLKPEPVEEVDRFGNKVTVMRILALEGLTSEARDFFAMEIMRLTKPALFEDEEAAKASQKETPADSSVA